MRSIFTWMIITSLVASPVTAQAADPPGRSEADVKLRNVELNKAGQLEGQLLNAKGQPISHASVVVRAQKKRSDITHTVKTDADGRFKISNLRRGICVFEVGKDSYACRVWAQGSAPPRSLKSVSVVQYNGAVVRGANQVNELAALSPATKILLGILFAAAIAIPIAVDDDDVIIDAS